MEYVIWGIPPHKDAEEILCINIDGKTIKDEKLAQWAANQLSDLYGCTNVRIQTIDLNTAPDFVGALNA